MSIPRPHLVAQKRDRTSSAPVSHLVYLAAYRQEGKAIIVGRVQGPGSIVQRGTEGRHRQTDPAGDYLSWAAGIQLLVHDSEVMMLFSMHHTKSCCPREVMVGNENLTPVRMSN